MKLKIVAVRDRATDQFSNPIFVVSTGVAIRSFADEINRADAQNAIYAHPEDYDLFVLGDWDTNSGVFDCLSRPEQLAIGKDLVIKKG